MNRLNVVKLSNGAHMGLSIIEVKGVLSAKGSQDADSVYRQNKQIYVELLTCLHTKENAPDRALELLYVTEPVSGQLYKAEVHIFYILRVYAIDEDLAFEKLKRWTEYTETVISRGGIALNRIDYKDSSFANLINSVQCDSIQTILKKEKMQRIGGTFVYPYADSLDSISEEAINHLVNGLNRYSNVAVSIQILPSSLSMEEIIYISRLEETINQLMPNITIYSDASWPHNDNISKGYKYYHNLLNESRASLYQFGVFVVGNQHIIDDLSSLVIANLQYNNRAELCCELLNYKTQITTNGLYVDFAILPWICMQYVLSPEYKKYIRQQPSRITSLITLKEASNIFHTPIIEKYTVGIAENQRKPLMNKIDRNFLNSDNIQLGSIFGIDEDGNNYPIGVPETQLTKHMLITGMPGSGKTTFSIDVLYQLYLKGIPFLVIEPTKTEYRVMLDCIKGLRIFTPGKNDVVPFIINPFIPPKGVTLEVYKTSLISAFKIVFSMPSPLDVLFFKAIDMTYTIFGWKPYSKVGDSNVRAFGLYEFIKVFKVLIEKSSYSEEIKGNLISAGIFRLMNLITQNGNIFDTINTIDIDELLNHPTIIELNAIGDQTQKSLIMALLLTNIVLHTKQNSTLNDGLKNAILIDEAHVLLDSKNASNDDDDPENATAKIVQNMIAEIRAYGTAIIIADQSPLKVTQPVIGNTNVKVVFRLVSPLDRRIIAESIGLDDTDSMVLSRFSTGEACVTFDGLIEPIRIQTKNVRETLKLRSNVSDDEVRCAVDYWDTASSRMIPYRECKMNELCREKCDQKCRQDANYYALQIYMILQHETTDKISFFREMLKIGSHFKMIGLEHDKKLMWCTALQLMRKTQLDGVYTISGDEEDEMYIRWIKDIV